MSELLGRYAVRPGISGPAQVSGHRGETPDAASMRARVAFDLRCIDARSIGLDLRIALLTPRRGWRDAKAC